MKKEVCAELEELISQLEHEKPQPAEWRAALLVKSSNFGDVYCRNPSEIGDILIKKKVLLGCYVAKF